MPVKSGSLAFRFHSLPRTWAATGSQVTIQNDSVRCPLCIPPDISMLGWNPSRSLCIAAIVLQTLADSTANTANPQKARSHRATAKRVDNSTFPLDERAQFVNQKFNTYGTIAGGGLDACGGEFGQDSDFYVAVAPDVNRLVSIKVEARLTVHCQQFGDGSNCGKQITITVNGTTTSANCLDVCAGCSSPGQLVLSEGLFEYLGGNPDIGIIHGSWSFTDVSGGGNDSVISRSSGASADLASQTPNPIQKKPRYYG
ncbi:hypothetical protein B0H13DRAFT_1858809 [Mycena leptocephala]|nr:hypothetical protein B0H13DRAFT_1858809 [Mycena leptocephala]